MEYQPHDKYLVIALTIFIIASLMFINATVHFRPLDDVKEGDMCPLPRSGECK